VGASAQRLADELGTIADENSRLHATQRTVAQTLQQSLLPQRLPEIAGLVLAVRYMPGVAGVDIACVSTKIGPTVGVRTSTPYESVTISVPNAATLLADTDGLVERRGEHLDVGLERLRGPSHGWLA
jgi:serine phosphatase RsbU (regulator of sigma subunit)